MEAEEWRGAGWDAGAGDPVASRYHIRGRVVGTGKAIDINEQVPIPSGWTTMGRLRAGDVVFTETGFLCRVLIAHRIDVNPVSYRLEFDDGAVLYACADHLWLTYNSTELTALSHRTPEWRAQRRAKRPSRANGTFGPLD